MTTTLAPTKTKGQHMTTWNATAEFTADGTTPLQDLEAAFIHLGYTHIHSDARRNIHGEETGTILAAWDNPLLANGSTFYNVAGEIRQRLPLPEHGIKPGIRLVNITRLPDMKTTYVDQHGHPANNF